MPLVEGERWRRTLPVPQGLHFRFVNPLVVRDSAPFEKHLLHRTSSAKQPSGRRQAARF
jgi:hypothetical protein